MDGAGAAYVFVRNGNNWVQQAYLKASNPAMSAEFGHAVAISADGNTIVVSAFWEPSKATGVNGDQADQSIPQAGAAYVFTRRGTTWSQQAYLKASNTGEAGTADTFAEGDQFGFSVAISDDGNTIAVGAHSEDSSGINGNQNDNSMQLAGAVYVYNRSGRLVGADGVPEVDQSRRRRHVRLLGVAQRRRPHASPLAPSTRTARSAASTVRPTTRATAPAPSTST